MRKIKHWLVCLVLLCLMCSVCVCAAPQRLVDDADLLSVDEEAELQAALDALSEQYSLDVVIVTVASTDGKTSMDYADDYFDYNGYREDGALLLVDTESRDCWISTSGSMIRILDDSAIDSVLDLIVDDLSNGFYDDAFETFIGECEYYIDVDINGVPFDFGFTLIVSLVIGFVIAFIVTGVMRGQLKSVRTKAAASDYVKTGSMNVTEASEFFLYRNVSRVRKSSDSNGSSTHRSSSGRSHGGGGRSF